jgi:hypothetical protein
MAETGGVEPGHLLEHRAVKTFVGSCQEHDEEKCSMSEIVPGMWVDYSINLSQGVNGAVPTAEATNVGQIHVEQLDGNYTIVRMREGVKA